MRGPAAPLIHADDPGERLALCDAHGRPLDAAATRGAIHRQGLWHRSFHCWVVRRGARGPELLLQRRARTKDTWPGAWDVSAAGHYRAGEGLAGGCREIAEELGLSVMPAELVPLGRHREVNRYPGGLWDREYQDVYLLSVACSLASFAPDATEVIGLAFVPADALVALAAGRRGRLATTARLATDGGWVERPIHIARRDLVTRAGSYYTRVARAARRLTAP